MLALEHPVNSSNPRSFRISPVSEPQLAKALADSIAFRTNQIQRANGRDPNRRLHDFLVARSEIYRRMYGAVFSAKGCVDVVADISCFEMGEEIRIYLEPRRVILSGKAGASLHGEGSDGTKVEFRGNTILRFLDLHEEIDPSHATAEIDGCVLEIFLSKSNTGRRAA